MIYFFPQQGSTGSRGNSGRDGEPGPPGSPGGPVSISRWITFSVYFQQFAKFNFPMKTKILPQKMIFRSYAKYLLFLSVFIALFVCFLFVVLYIFKTFYHI